MRIRTALIITLILLLGLPTLLMPPKGSAQERKPDASRIQDRDLRSGQHQNIPRDTYPQLLDILLSDFEIASERDEAWLEFNLKQAGLHSAEIRFHLEDTERKYDRLVLSFESGSPSDSPVWRPGDYRKWFEQPRMRILDPQTSYRFYFWVDEEMLYQLGDNKTLRIALRRLDRLREIPIEFSTETEKVKLPRMVGRGQVRAHNPIEVEALPTDNPIALQTNLLTREIVHYRVKADFPRVQGRMAPYQFKTEFRVPESRGVRNADLGGFLLKDGQWIRANRVSGSGTFDFLASPATEFSKDVYGRRKLSPSEEDWNQFKAYGLLFILDNSPTVRASALFYLDGGQVPPTYHVIELEDINLNPVPGEGGVFWLGFNNVSVLSWVESSAVSDNAFAKPIRRSIIQANSERIPFCHSCDIQQGVRAQLPLLALPVNKLDGKQVVTVTFNPHYFHTMSVPEEAKFIYDHTGAGKVIEGFAKADYQKVAEGIIEWIIKASEGKNPDLYRSFGVGVFETDEGRGWALRNSPERFQVEGASSGSTTFREVSGTTSDLVARTSAIGPGNEAKRTFNSTIRVRRIPGIFVEDAQIKILNVKTNRNFNGHIKVRFGIIGHNGGREQTSGQGLDLEKAAVGTPFSYWAGKITERGPFNLRRGARRNISFDTIDFSHPDRDPISLWEQLHHTLGAWAGLHIQVALVNMREMDGQTVLSPETVEVADYKDVGYLTIYPWDHLYDPTFGRLRNDIERDGDWVILRGRIEPHGRILDEVELEVRLKVRALDTGTFIRMTTRN